jgi:thioredoxin reductase
MKRARGHSRLTLHVSRIMPCDGQVILDEAVVVSHAGNGSSAWALILVRIFWANV